MTMDSSGVTRSGSSTPALTGIAGTYDLAALKSIKQRVEEAIRFLHFLRHWPDSGRPLDSQDSQKVRRAADSVG